MRLLASALLASSLVCAAQLEEEEAKKGCIVLPNLGAWMDGATGRQLVLNHDSVEVRTELLESAGFAESVAREHLARASVENIDLEGSVAEHVRRQVRLSLFRRLEAASFWQGTEFGDSVGFAQTGAALECIVFEQGFCEMRAEMVAELSTLGLISCLTVGRGLVDICSRNDLLYLVGGRRPGVVVVSRWPLECSLDAARNMLDSLAFGGKVIIHGLSTMEEVATVVSDLTAVGLCARFISNSSSSSDDEVGGYVTGLAGLEPNFKCSDPPSTTTKIPKAFVISLDRHVTSRWPSFQARNEKTRAILGDAFPLVERFSAVDGAIHAAPTSELRRLFWRKKPSQFDPYEDHGMRPGVVGCALSHLVLWSRLAATKKEDLDAYLILEDDADLSGVDFPKRWRSEVVDSGLMQDPRWDVVFLAFMDPSPLHASGYAWPGISRRSRRSRSRGGGTYGYLVRARGAARLLKHARLHGVPQAVDWFMMEAAGLSNEVVAYQSSPELILSKSTFGSSTHEPYPWTLDHVCAHRETFHRKSLVDEIVGGATVGIQKTGFFMENNNPLVPPDFEIRFIIELSPGADVAAFKAGRECLQVCYNVDRPVLSPRDALGCTYVFEDHSSSRRYMDPSATDPNRVHALHFTVFDGQFLMANLAPQGPQLFRVPASHIELSFHDEILKVHYYDLDQATFLNKHATDLLCLISDDEGARFCAHLGSFPTVLDVVASGHFQVSLKSLMGTDLCSLNLELATTTIKVQLHNQIEKQDTC